MADLASAIRVRSSAERMRSSAVASCCSTLCMESPSIRPASRSIRFSTDLPISSDSRFASVSSRAAASSNAASCPASQATSSRPPPIPTVSSAPSGLLDQRLELGNQHIKSRYIDVTLGAQAFQLTREGCFLLLELRHPGDKGRVVAVRRRVAACYRGAQAIQRRSNLAFDLYDLTHGLRFPLNSSRFRQRPGTLQSTLNHSAPVPGRKYCAPS